MLDLAESHSEELVKWKYSIKSVNQWADEDNNNNNREMEQIPLSIPAAE
jgi:hypothetical protein